MLNRVLWTYPRTGHRLPAADRETPSLVDLTRGRPRPYGRTEALRKLAVRAGAILAATATVRHILDGKGIADNCICKESSVSPSASFGRVVCSHHRGREAIHCRAQSGGSGI